MDTESLDNFRRALGHIRNRLQPLNCISKDETAGLLTPLEVAKLRVTLVYSLACLYYMLLRAQGVDPKGHPVKADLERIRGYVARLKQVEKAAAGASSGSGGTVGGPSLRLDQNASNRFIARALAGDPVYEKALTGTSDTAGP